MSDVAEIKLKAVIYTDGGCKAPGVGGWGLHGYTYLDIVPKQGSGAKGVYPTAMGYTPNEQKGKESSPTEVTLQQYVEGLGAIFPDSTNNEAELMALHRALRFLKDQSIAAGHLILDSKYVLQGAQEWARVWKRNGWTTTNGNPAANIALWEEILVLLDYFQTQAIPLTWAWVKGHSGNVGNEAADKLASKAVLVGQNYTEFDHIETHDPKGFWARSPEYNRMLSHTRMYFNTALSHPIQSYDGRAMYYLSDLSGADDDAWGKRSTETAFSILYLKDPDPALDAVIQHQIEVAKKTALKSSRWVSPLTIGRLDNIISPNNYEEIATHGGRFLRQMGQKIDLFDVLENPITRELLPPGRAYQAEDVFKSLEVILLQYLNIDVSNEWGLVVTDITPNLYEKSVTKKKTVVKLKSTFDSTLRAFDVPVSYDVGAGLKQIDLKLLFGLDIAKRNTLAALASEHLSVKVLTWKESPCAFRYATIIQSDSDVGIWAGVYSNLRTVD